MRLTLSPLRYVLKQQMGTCSQYDMGLQQEPYIRVRFPSSSTPIFLPIVCLYDYLVSVNLGGWLVLEPFITPQYYEKYNGTVDEWTLSLAIAADPSSGGLQSVLENHYNTFIVSGRLLFIAFRSLVPGSLRQRFSISIPILAIDRRRLCSDCWCWAQLGSYSVPILGN